MKTTLYYNPDCSKCRESKELLENASCEFELVEYLKETPSASELNALLHILKLKAIDLIRTGEEIYKSQFEGKTFSEQEWIQVLVENPILIERPILIHGNKAIIGRPPSKILEIL